MMVQKLEIFEPRFNNEELEEEFNKFFFKNNLTPLFTNEHRAGSISVTYLDARSVIKPGGSYNKTLLEFADILQMNWDNKSFEEALFKMIYEARSFGKLMKIIEETIRYVYDLDEDRQHNMWNIIWYTKEVY